MLYVGIGLLVVAVIAFFYGRSERGKARRARATETMSCGDVSSLSTGVAGEVGGGNSPSAARSSARAGPDRRAPARRGVEGRGGVGRARR
jgi:hypothetical protein